MNRWNDYVDFNKPWAHVNDGECNYYTQLKPRERADDIVCDFLDTYDTNGVEECRFDIRLCVFDGVSKTIHKVDARVFVDGYCFD